MSSTSAAHTFHALAHIFLAHFFTPAIAAQEEPADTTPQLHGRESSPHPRDSCRSLDPVTQVGIPTRETGYHNWGSEVLLASS